MVFFFNIVYWDWTEVLLDVGQALYWLGLSPSLIQNLPYNSCEEFPGSLFILFSATQINEITLVYGQDKEDSIWDALKEWKENVFKKKGMICNFI